MTESRLHQDVETHLNFYPPVKFFSQHIVGIVIIGYSRVHFWIILKISTVKFQLCLLQILTLRDSFTKIFMIEHIM